MEQNNGAWHYGQESNLPHPGPHGGPGNPPIQYYDFVGTADPMVYEHYSNPTRPPDQYQYASHVPQYQSMGIGTNGQVAGNTYNGGHNGGHIGAQFAYTHPSQYHDPHIQLQYGTRAHHPGTNVVGVGPGSYAQYGGGSWPDELPMTPYQPAQQPAARDSTASAGVNGPSGVAAAVVSEQAGSSGDDYAHSTTVEVQVPEGYENNVVGCPGLLVGKSTTPRVRVEPKMYEARRVPFALVPGRSSPLRCESYRDMRSVKRLVDDGQEALKDEYERLNSLVYGNSESDPKPDTPKDDARGQQQAASEMAGNATEAKESATMDSPPKEQTHESALQNAKERCKTIVTQSKHDVNVSSADVASELARYMGEIADEMSGLKILSAGFKDKDKKIRVSKADKDTAKAALGRLQEVLNVIICAAVKDANDATLQQMGKFPKQITMVLNALLRLFTSKDVNGTEAKACLEFLSKITEWSGVMFDRIKPSTLEKLKEPMDNKSLDYRGRKLLQKFLNNFENQKPKDKAESSRATAELDEEKQPSTATMLPSANTSTPKQVSRPSAPLQYTLKSAKKHASGTKVPPPAKRSRDDDSTTRASKKMVVEDASGLRTLVKVPSNPATKSSSGTPAATAQAPTRQPVLANSRLGRPQSRGETRGGSKIGGLLDEIEKPQAKPKANAHDGSKIGGLLDEIERPRPKTESQDGSKIGNLLDQIAKPSEAPKKAKEPEGPPLTAEQLARKLRKEKRRGLRVRFKPDAELSEIRYFQHDTAEDEGRASNMVRDAHDSRSEGQLLRRDKRTHEQEEEGDNANTAKPPVKDYGLTPRPWNGPQSSDLSLLPQEMSAKSYATRGGVHDVSSKQKTAMEQYESRELMAVYTDPSEIPASARSPPSRVSEAFASPHRSGLPPTEPTLQESYRRWNDAGTLQSASARNNAYRRLGMPVPAPQPTPLPTPRPMTQEERDGTVLALLNSDRVKHWQDPDPNRPPVSYCPTSDDPQTQQGWNLLYNVSNQLKNEGYPPREAPQWLHREGPARVQEWYQGRDNDLAAKAQKEASERAAQMFRSSAVGQYPAQGNPYAAQPMPQQHVAQQQPVAQQQHHYSQQGAPDIARILQQVQALQRGVPPQATGHAPTHLPAPTPALSQTPAPAPAPAPAVDPNVATILAALGQANQARPVQAPVQPQAPVNQDYQLWIDWAQAQAANLQRAQYDGTSSGFPSPYGAQPPHGQQAYAAQQAYPAQQTWGQGYQPQQSQSQSQSQYAQHGQEQRQHAGQHHGQEQRHHRDNERNGRKEFHRGGGGGGNKDSKGINRALINTKACTFWAKGQCAKGDDCTFRHDPNDL
ncbi:hypothetical protein F4780DRAFT_504114 [Xylariomycetidae sp. FL0641]|nr:hypothetical protein F4780DRAFT_504114 [Xylariomycetidae sp. FL0641]